MPADLSHSGSFLSTQRKKILFQSWSQLFRTEQVLDLSNNDLSGPIPWSCFGDGVGSRSAFGLKHGIDNLLVQNNQLSRDVVDVMAQSLGIWIMDVLELQNNLCTGDLSRIIDMSLDQPESLEWLYTSAIMIFDGVRPKGFLIQFMLRWRQVLFNSSHWGLKEIWLTGNNFSGTCLPQTSFVHPSLEDVVYTYNDLAGQGIDRGIHSDCCNTGYI